MKTLPRLPKETSVLALLRGIARVVPEPGFAPNPGADHRNRIRKPWFAALGLWLSILILTPIGLWTVGSNIFPALASAGVLTHALVTGLALVFTKPTRWILGSLLTIAGISWGIEALGVATGIPFGHYSYTTALQPQVLGVPLLIPLAWFMMLAPAWGVTERVFAGVRARLGWRYWPIYATVAALAMTAWDLYLDPQMVAQGLWQWAGSGGYFGIPWLNFFGWWLTAFFITILIRPENLPQRPLLLVYTLTWAFQAVGLGIFWDQPGPATAGFLGMGIFVGLGWFQEFRRWTS